jgi:hypothetical protein
MAPTSATPGSTRLATALTAAVVAISVAGWIFTENPVLALAPVVSTLVVWALVGASPHRVAQVVFFVALVAENPKEVPAEGLWRSPLYPLGALLYENLPLVHLTAMDLLAATLFVLAAVRAPRGDVVPVPRAFLRCLALAWLAVMWIEAWGLLRGGQIRATIWQIRGVFWAPALAYVFATSLRGPRDLPAVGKAVVAAALVKAAMGLYYFEIVAPRLGRWPAYTTTHSDTVLFVTAAVIALATLLERRSLRAAVHSLAIVVPVGAAIIVNNRRLAYVDLFGTCVAIYLVLPTGPLLRAANRTLTAVAPLTAVYLAIGWTSEASIFGPARKVASLFSKEDRSAAMRDIENYNLLSNWKDQIFLGSGFGHEYTELTRPEGIEQIFPLYRYIAHNSVLWLENTGGVIGFAAYWTLPALVVYLAARSHRFASSATDRAAALVALSVPVTYSVQAYGDMGLSSWTATFTLAMALAAAAKLAAASGALSTRTAP